MAKAKAELAKSKYPQGFTTELLIDGGVQKWRTFAQIIQQQLKPIGIDVKIRALDHAAYHAAFQKFDYEMFIDYAINDISDADEMASFEVDVQNGGSTSYWSNYNSPTAIKAVRAASAEFNPRKRAALYAQMQKIVAQDAPFVPLDYPTYIYAASKKVHGLRGQPRGRLPSRERLAGLRRVTRYAARRLASAVFVALGVTIATFLLLHVEPGDPARLVLGRARAAVGDRARYGTQWGLDASLPSTVHPLRVEPRARRSRPVVCQPCLLCHADRRSASG